MIEAIARESWDVVIAGAGPAGALAAFLLARQGRRVLLCDRTDFPRDKPCGGCLNHIACATLREAGLQCVLQGSARIDHVRFLIGLRCIALDAVDSCAIARADLDAALVGAATAAGATFAPGCRILRIGNAPHLRSAGRHFALRTSLTLAADGLSGDLLDAESPWQIASNAWIGIAAKLPASAIPVAPATLTMHVGAGGYVGVVRFADNALHVAAAFAPELARRAGGPAVLMRSILRTCGTDAADLRGLPFRGTPPLTRRRKRLGAHRILAVGDACGYVEPFTGEGIAWALQSAQALCDLLPINLKHWPDELPSAWTRQNRRLLARQQAICRGLRLFLHRPMLARFAADFSHMFPAVPARILHHVQGLGPCPINAFAQ